MMINDLEKPREILWRFFKREGRLPSYGEMTTLFGYASKNAAYKVVQKMIAAGLLEKSGGHLQPKKLATPIRLLGEVQAGFPSPAEEELLDTLTLDDYLVKKPQASFLLKVSGESMIDEGIRPGDLVVIERGVNPKHGDIVLAKVDGEWTLKFFEKQGKSVRLIAANKKYLPIVPQHELLIEGVLRSCIRRYF